LTNNTPPIADVRGPSLVEAGQGVTLDASHSSDPDAAVGDHIVSFAWDLNNDGDFSDATGATLTVPWEQLRLLGLGTHPVSVRVTDTFGATSTATTNLTIQDTTPPLISGARTTQPNAAGWYNHDVTVHFTASDGGSGIAGVTPDQVLSAEGPNQSATGTATDRAGNSATATVSGINIDETPPVTTVASVSGPIRNSSGWYTGAVTVTLNATDQPDLSGVDTTYYTVDGEGPQTGTTIALTSDGTHAIQYWSVDVAGNVEAAHSLTVQIDQTAPTISAVRDLLAYAADHGGWNNADVTASYTASDAGGSGLASDAGGSHVFTTEGAGQSCTFTVYDVAGNSASATIDNVSIDKTAPVLTDRLDGNPASTGWYNVATGPAVVTYTAGDGLSGVGTPASYTFADGVGQSLAGITVTDVAGNVSAPTADITGINQDTLPPTLSQSISNPDPTTGWYNIATGPAVVHYTAFDATSGVSAPADHSFGEGSNQSLQGITVTDAAGNTSLRTDDLKAINVDLHRPTVSAAATTEPNGDGWYNTNVTVRYTSDDSLSGVVSNPADQVLSDEGSAVSSASDVTVTDVAGNTSAPSNVVTVRIDKNAPVTQISLSGAEGGDGWYTSPVILTLTAEDKLSGVAGTYYAVDGGEPQRGTVVTLTADGTHTVRYWSLDRAGNIEAAQTRTINIDATAPVLTATATPSTLWPPNGKMVTVLVSGTIMDLGSDVDWAGATFTTVDSYGQVQPKGSFTVDPNGDFCFSLQLEARRNGQDKAGRVYRITLSVRDLAGNLGTLTLTVLVPHDQGNG
jgi:hypothetical protein